MDPNSNSERFKSLIKMIDSEFFGLDMLMWHLVKYYKEDTIHQHLV